MIDRSIPVSLGEKEYRLQLTLHALERIERDLGSLFEARQRVAMHSFQAIVQIITAGANLSESQVKELKKEVFSAGVVNVAPAVNAFIVRLHDPEGAEEGAEEGSGEV